MRGIQENEECIIRLLLATLAEVHEPRLAAEPHRERLCWCVSPIPLRHLCTVRAQPDDILNLGAGDRLAEEEPVAVEDDVCSPKPDELTCEGEQRFASSPMPSQSSQLISLSWQ